MNLHQVSHTVVLVDDMGGTDAPVQQHFCSLSCYSEFLDNSLQRGVRWGKRDSFIWRETQTQQLEQAVNLASCEILWEVMQQHGASGGICSRKQTSGPLFCRCSRVRAEYRFCMQGFLFRSASGHLCKTCPHLSDRKWEETNINLRTCSVCNPEALTYSSADTKLQPPCVLNPAGVTHSSLFFLLGPPTDPLLLSRGIKDVWRFSFSLNSVPLCLNFKYEYMWNVQ